MNLSEIDIREITLKILSAPKYRDLGLNTQTIEHLIRQEAPNLPSQKRLLKSVRRKLHNIVAPYLGEPDYVELSEQLSKIKDASLESDEVRRFSLDVLSQHTSSAERLPHLEAFYDQLFQVTGKPNTILDLACGLHPIGFPFMGLPPSTQYYAYDIVQPRIDFINTFFVKSGMMPLAENRDILVSPPPIHADLGLFFKEAHRFEKRAPGCNRSFWASLDVDILAVSLPVADLSGAHNLIDRHRRLVYDNLPQNQGVSEVRMDNEIIFLINQPGD